MGIIKTFEEFSHKPNKPYWDDDFSHNPFGDIDLRHTDITKLTYNEAIDNLQPVEHIIVEFPEGFELEYKSRFSRKLEKFNCMYLDVTQWDEEGAFQKSYEFWQSKETFKPRGATLYGSTCYWGELTDESKKKVRDYLRTTKCAKDSLNKRID